MKHTILALFALLFTPLTAMDQPIQTKLKNIPSFQLATFPRIFDACLPSEINGKIFDTVVFHFHDITLKDPVVCNITLKKTAYLMNRFLNHFSLICKSTNKFIKKNTLPFIKMLSTSFTCSDEFSANALQTQAANEIVMKQLGFAHLCATIRYDPISLQQANLIKKNNIDLNFTYGGCANTQLMITFEQTLDKGKLSIIKWLIENRADLNIVNTAGETAVFLSTKTWIDDDKQPIEYLWNHPSFDANREYMVHGHKTSLLFSLLISFAHCTTPNEQKRKTCYIRLIKELCRKGADTEGIIEDIFTALSRARKTEDQELINVLEDAIAEKYARQKNQSS